MFAAAGNVRDAKACTKDFCIELCAGYETTLVYNTTGSTRRPMRNSRKKHVTAMDFKFKLRTTTLDIKGKFNRLLSIQTDERMPGAGVQCLNPQLASFTKETGARNRH